jgi:L-lactate dehydrogenase
MSLKPKVSVIDAGNVGMRYIYSLMISGFARSIVVIDNNKARAEGEVMDLKSCMPFVSQIEISAGDYKDIENSDIVVITAGAKQKPGQARLELVKENIAIFKGIIPEIMKYAPNAIFLVVTNPVDVLSFAAHKISKKPWQEIIGSGTVLDSARLRLLLSQHCNIDARNVHAYVLGEHGDSEFAVWSRAMIGGALFKEYCAMCNKCDRKTALGGIVREVKEFAYKVIERKGETSYGVGLSMTMITRAILKDENSILPVSCLVNDYYGINGVYLSLPSIVNKKGIRETFKIPLSEEEEGNLKNSADILKSVIKASGL